ncbi:hypothetical protein AZE42_07940 [Rhizopogon vesiculosus]|uniref:Uncharacterized protein n=1 Tax=Rhizopogon vesiculosus TaxID=180088 RepID=A0A1J8PXR2_9AGAM|nr:hypothetical protein AZE42_07940 [Rhizopogon vesiculosus]
MRFKHATRFVNNFPSGAEVSAGECGTFPFIRILHRTAGEELVQCIAQDVTSGALENLSFDQASLKVKRARIIIETLLSGQAS